MRVEEGGVVVVLRGGWWVVVEIWEVLGGTRQMWGFDGRGQGR